MEKQTEISIYHDLINQAKAVLIGYQVFFDDDSNKFYPLKNDGNGGINVEDLPTTKRILRMVQVGKIREKAGNCESAKSIRNINNHLIYYPIK